jgi:hypothetical protein
MTGGSAGGDGIRAHREDLMPADTWWDRRACVGRTRSAAMAWPCDEDVRTMCGSRTGGWSLPGVMSD